jgi:hypothetical protein
MNSKAAARTLLTKAPVVKIIEILKILIQTQATGLNPIIPKVNWK